MMALLVTLAAASCQIINGADDFTVEQPSTASGFSFPTGSGGGVSSGGQGGGGSGGAAQGGAGGDNG